MIDIQHLRIIQYWNEFGKDLISLNILRRYIDEIYEDIRRIDILLSKRILLHSNYEIHIKKLFVFYRRLNNNVLITYLKSNIK